MCETLRAGRARSIPTEAVTVYARHVGTKIVILGARILILDVVAQVGFKVSKQMSQTRKIPIIFFFLKKSSDCLLTENTELHHPLKIVFFLKHVHNLLLQ